MFQIFEFKLVGFLFHFRAVGASLGPRASLCLGSCVCSIYVYQDTRLGYVFIFRAVGFFFQGAACVIFQGGAFLIFWGRGRLFRAAGFSAQEKA